MLIGCEIALNELYEAGAIKKLPKIFIVQSEKCAPFLWATSEPRAIKPEPTLAEGIAIAKPARGAEILASRYAGEREVIAIKEEDIEPARNFLSSRGFYVEYTTAAIYAAYASYAKSHKIEGRSIISMCGAGLKSEH